MRPGTRGARPHSPEPAAGAGRGGAGVGPRLVPRRHLQRGPYLGWPFTAHHSQPRGAGVLAQCRQQPPTQPGGCPAPAAAAHLQPPAHQERPRHGHRKHRVLGTPQLGQAVEHLLGQALPPAGATPVGRGRGVRGGQGAHPSALSKGHATRDISQDRCPVAPTLQEGGGCGWPPAGASRELGPGLALPHVPVSRPRSRLRAFWQQHPLKGQEPLKVGAQGSPPPLPPLPPGARQPCWPWPAGPAPLYVLLYVSGTRTSGRRAPCERPGSPAGPGRRRAAWAAPPRGSAHPARTWRGPAPAASRPAPGPAWERGGEAAGGVGHGPHRGWVSTQSP